MIERRMVMIALGLYAVAVPLAARAQQTQAPTRVAVLFFGSPETTRNYLDVFKTRMRELGYVEGRDVVYELRWAYGKVERLPELGRELVTLHPDVIVATSTVSARAAQQATGSIAIVGLNMSDPVASGLAKSLGRPGGNITGLADLSDDASPKRLELLRAALPKLSRVVVLGTPTETFPEFMKNLRSAAQTVGVEVSTIDVSTPAEIAIAFDRMTREHIDAVIMTSTFLNLLQSHLIADLALRHRMPTTFMFRGAVEAGGLMSYGVDVADIFRHGAIYVDKILKGTKPADLPIEQPTRFEFVINLKTAKALGLTIPPALLLYVDAVIE